MITEEDLIKDPTLAKYYGLRPGRFHHVESLVLRQSDEYGGYGNIASLDLIVSSDQEVAQLHLKFSGVLNLRITPPDRMVINLSSLEIFPIRDLQWEGVCYKVRETEDNTLSFLCRDFSAELSVD